LFLPFFFFQNPFCGTFDQSHPLWLSKRINGSDGATSHHCRLVHGFLGQWLSLSPLPLFSCSYQWSEFRLRAKSWLSWVWNRFWWILHSIQHCQKALASFWVPIWIKLCSQVVPRAVRLLNGGTWKSNNMAMGGRTIIMSQHSLVCSRKLDPFLYFSSWYEPITMAFFLSRDGRIRLRFLRSLSSPDQNWRNIAG
jgi:hypothetical protein